MNSLKEIAMKMTEKGKGILAADESTPTCTKRFDSIGVESTYESRNEYRGLLMTSPVMERYISGVIMFEETFNQTTVCNKNIPFPDQLQFLIVLFFLLDTLIIVFELC